MPGFRAVVAAAAGVVCPLVASAAPYVSGVNIVGTTVSFFLNEDADSLTLSINGGSPVPLTPTRGLQTFTLSSPTDTFSLSALKLNADGYTRRNDATVVASPNGLSVDVPQAQLRAISSVSNPLTRFNGPRGVAVNRDPNAGPLFGTAYIANGAAGSYGGAGTLPGGPESARSLGDGLYALNPDQTDRFGYGDTAQTGGITAWAATPSTEAPYRLTVGPDHRVYVADWSDATGTVWRLNSDLTGGVNVLDGIGGPSTPAGFRNHGSVAAVHVEGTLEGGNLTVFTLDEDITSQELFGSGSNANRNSLWRYNIGSGPLPHAALPDLVNPTPALIGFAATGGVVVDLARGADGKFYLSQNRSVGTESGVFVLDADGNILFSSLTASRDLLGNPSANDILRNVRGIDVSPDQKWLAAALNNSRIAVVPLVDGIPDLANVTVIETGPEVNIGRDVAFDAAGNLHYISSGQAIYRVLARGGSTLAVTSWNGTSFSFSIGEPPTGPNIVLGDFNFDGFLDAGDIDVFTEALLESAP
ncbi:MAG: hypothetical protein ACK4PI_04790, partial [Tepidisphaerales bacterium]